MNEKIKSKLYACLLLLFVFFPKFSMAANPDVVKMDDLMWSNGKIYVVVLVVFTIFIGVMLTLLYLERKIKKLENEK